MPGFLQNSFKQRNGLDSRRAGPFNRLFSDIKQVARGALFRHSSQLDKLDTSLSPEEGMIRWVNGSLQVRKSDGRWYIIELTERADYDLSGTVTNTLSGSPETGVTVTVASTGQTALTDGSGDYSIDNVPKGASVLINGDKTGYNQSSDNANLAASDGTLDFDIARRSVTGNITSSHDATDVVGATVEITSLPRSGTSDGSGDYSLIDVPDGSYTLEASKSGWNAYSNPITVAGDLVQNIIMTPILYTVSGLITSSETGLLIPGADVQIGVNAAEVTDASGNYSDNSVSAATHDFDVTKTGYITDYNGSIVVAGSMTRDQAVTPIERSIQSGPAFSWNGAHSYTYGYQFTSSQTLKVYKVGYYLAGTGSLSFNVRLYRVSDGAVLIDETVSAYGTGWIYNTLGSVYTLPAGQYILAGYVAANTRQPYGAGNVDHEYITVTADLYSAGQTKPLNTNPSPVRGFDMKVKI